MIEPMNPFMVLRVIVSFDECLLCAAAFQRVPLLIASANRDESRWGSGPTDSTSTAASPGILRLVPAFMASWGRWLPGSRAKRCALAARVASITIESDAVHRDSTGLRALSSLPVRVVGNDVQRRDAPFAQTRRRGGNAFTRHTTGLCKSGPGCSRAKTLAALMVGP
jgi:hypothetical protein